MRRLAPLIAACLVTGCSATYIDDDGAVRSAPSSAPTSVALSDRSTDELTADISNLMFDLDQRIIDNDGERSTLEQIEARWAELKPRLEGDDRYRYGQAIEFAQTAVDRNRPADASKGYKILRDLQR